MKNAKKKKKTKAATPDITFSSYKKVESNYATK